jgi:type I restriction enzyme M protein
MSSTIANTRKSRADSDALGRFYTSGPVARVLAQKLEVISPQTILDLGCGSGNLSDAVPRSVDTQVVTADIDPQVTAAIAERFEGVAHRHVQADILSLDLADALALAYGSVDVAVCNPPFVRPVWRETFTTILTAAGFDPGCLPPATQVQADLLFIAQNLRLLRDGGLLGLVVPASFVSGKPYRAFRAALLAAHRVISVVRLPRNAFPRADARAFLLTLQKGHPTDGLIAVTSLSAGQVESAPHYIEAREAAVRQDGTPDDEFEGQADIAVPADTPTLADVALSVVRGSFKPGAAAAALAPHPLFHTTHFPDAEAAAHYAIPTHLDIAQPRAGITVAEPDDLLIARVGRNFHRKVCRISAGNAVMTDNVFRIRVRAGESQRVFDALTSPRGQLWLSRTGYGVGARHITKTDLLRFPLFAAQ